MGCACARRARHPSHRDNFKSRDIMDAFDWPLARMRSLLLYFGGWSDSKPQNRVRDDPYLLLIFGPILVHAKANEQIILV